MAAGDVSGRAPPGAAPAGGGAGGAAGGSGVERIRRALLSVSDKTGLVDFARALRRHGVEILSTGGTAQALRAGDVPVAEVSEFTGFPEVLDGRVKTLHPKVHAGLLYLRDSAAHQRTMEEQGLLPIDLVAVNLYPFRETAARAGATHAEVVEQIDIGGPSMLRSAAKNHRWVAVLSRPDQYRAVVEEMERLGGATSLPLRERLACEVFRATSEYDRAIAAYLARGSRPPAPAAAEAGRLPEQIELQLEKTCDLRYGENPHQPAALFELPGLSFEDFFERLHGKELSYNNLLDLSAAESMLEEFPDQGPAAAVVVKHMNPCGVGVGASLSEAWTRALATDVESASGGIVAVNRNLDPPFARLLHEHFSEIVVAPGFHPEALELLREKKSRILVRRRTRLAERGPAFEVRSIGCGYLAQHPDKEDLDPALLRVVTRRPPTEREMEALRFAFRVAKHVKSNAIVLGRADRTLGIGAGQMSRVDAARIAVEKARRAGLDLRGSAAASEAFFPFPDGLVALAEAGATAAIQPGGSKRDAEVIAAADERGVAMVFTGIRHFRH